MLANEAEARGSRDGRCCRQTLEPRWGHGGARLFA